MPNARILDALSKLLMFSFCILVLPACGADGKSRWWHPKREAQSDSPVHKSDSSDQTEKLPQDKTPLGQNSEKPIAPEIAITDLPVDDSRLANTEEIISRLGLASYHQAGFHGQHVKIAVLDNGFAGLNNSIGKRLPPTARLLSSPRSEMQMTTHGVKLAEIVYAAATGASEYRTNIIGPDILLLNTNGYTNFAAAVDQVIKERVDIVLYAQVWEYGGNFDGTGFINKEVKRAIDAGILWVNAAGNLGQGTWSGPVAFDDQMNAKLPFAARNQSYVRFTVPQDQTPVKIVLAWNDFADDKDYKTNKDLDLFLEESDGSPLSSSRLVQDAQIDSNLSSGHSAHAREIIEMTLHAGTYFLRVSGKPANFDEKSRMRLTVDGLGVKMLDQTTDETVLIPADNPDVLTIGAADVDYSGREMRSGVLVKPEISVISAVSFEDGSSYKGTSAATALAVGALGVFRSVYGPITRSDVVTLAAAGILSPLLTQRAAGAFLLQLTDYSRVP